MREAMGRGLNSTRLRRQKRRLRLRVQKPRRQQEVSGHQGYGSQHRLCEPTYLAWSLLPSSLWVSFHSLCLSLTCFFFAFLSALDRLASSTDDLGAPSSISISSLRWLRFSSPHRGCSRRIMSSVEDWQPGVLSGRPELWNWREMWKPCGPSLESSAQSSRTAVGSGRGPLVNSASKTSGSASSWPRWDGPGPWRDEVSCTGPQLGGRSVDRLGWCQLQTFRWLHCQPSRTQASRTEQELQRELDTLRGQCQTQALAGAELRARLESLQAEVSSNGSSLRLS